MPPKILKFPSPSPSSAPPSASPPPFRTPPPRRKPAPSPSSPFFFAERLVPPLQAKGLELHQRAPRRLQPIKYPNAKLELPAAVSPLDSSGFNDSMLPAPSPPTVSPSPQPKTPPPPRRLPHASDSAPVSAQVSPPPPSSPPTLSGVEMLPEYTSDGLRIMYFDDIDALRFAQSLPAPRYTIPPPPGIFLLRPQQNSILKAKYPDYLRKSRIIE